VAGDVAPGYDATLFLQFLMLFIESQPTIVWQSISDCQEAAVLDTHRTTASVIADARGVTQTMITLTLVGCCCKAGTRIWKPAVSVHAAHNTVPRLQFKRLKHAAYQPMEPKLNHRLGKCNYNERSTTIPTTSHAVST
jgi:hypothetical protein